MCLLISVIDICVSVCLTVQDQVESLMQQSADEAGYVHGHYMCKAKFDLPFFVQSHSPPGCAIKHCLVLFHPLCSDCGLLVSL